VHASGAQLVKVSTELKWCPSWDLGIETNGTCLSPMASSYRDRTSEFRLLLETLKKIGSPVQPENAPSTSHGESYSRSEFNRKASRIGLGIHETSQKIARLTQLARKSSMFNDPAVEIQELTVLIKNEITALNSALFDLQTVQNTDMADGGYSQDTIVHSTAVCDDLKSKLMGATKHLQDVLAARTEVGPSITLFIVFSSFFYYMCDSMYGRI